MLSMFLYSIYVNWNLALNGSESMEISSSILVRYLKLANKGEIRGRKIEYLFEIVSVTVIVQCYTVQLFFTILRVRLTISFSNRNRFSLTIDLRSSFVKRISEIILVCYLKLAFVGDIGKGVDRVL